MAAAGGRRRPARALVDRRSAASTRRSCRASRSSPSEKTLEAPYIERNIKATRAAYGLDGVQTQTYEASTTATRDQLRDDAETIPGIRLVDPNVVSPDVQAAAGGASPTTTSRTRSTSTATASTASSATPSSPCASSTSSGVPASQRNWINDHTVYTHGYGVVAAYGNQRGEDGQPVFSEQNIPPVGKLGNFEPRIYFGEKSPDVLHRRRRRRAAAAASSTTRTAARPGRATTRTPGTGGVRLGSFARKAAYAIKFREPNFLLSDAVNDRLTDPLRPHAARPGREGRAVADPRRRPLPRGRRRRRSSGSSTATRRPTDYPYSRLQDIDDATSDSLTETSSAVRAIRTDQVNYIRNSVKATVDAYDGTVHALRVGRPGPGAQGLDEGVPRDGAADERDQRRPDGAPALPRGPVQGAAHDARALPRDRRRARSTAARTSGRCPTTRPRRRRP